MKYTVKISYDGQDRIVGQVIDDTLHCRRDVKKHLFRSGKPTVVAARQAHVSAWGLDCRVCDGLLERGVEYLEIIAGAGTYRCRLEDMKTKGFVLNMKPHRAQYFLNEEEFVRNGHERQV